MNEQQKIDMNPEQLRADLQQLFSDAGYVNDRLTQFIELAIHRLAELEELKIQNQRRAITTKKTVTDTMSSKLRDALRE